MQRRLMLVAALAVLMGGVLCGSAWGATAKVIQVSTPSENPDDAPDVRDVAALIANPGEVNRVRVTPAPTSATLLFEDLGAVLTVGTGCASVDAHHARCTNPTMQQALVYAGDLNDTVVSSPGVALEAHGGPGTDQLVGADQSDQLFGDGGKGDVLAGAAGDDTLSDGDGVVGSAIDADTLDGGAGRDTVSYTTRSSAVVVDLSKTTQADGDTLVGIENVDGSGAADQIIGSADKNELTGGAGKDVIKAGAGNDAIDGGPGDDRISAQAGADRVTGGKGKDKISLGDGNDTVDDEFQRTHTGRDQITCGKGRDQIKALRETDVDRLARDCELFTAYEVRVDGPYVFDSEAVTARLHSLRRSGRTARVTVKCARPKKDHACSISGELRSSTGRTIGRAIARVKVKPGRQGTLRLRLTRSGAKHVRRGRQVRLLLANRSRPAGELFASARSQAQVFVP